MDQVSFGAGGNQNMRLLQRVTNANKRHLSETSTFTVKSSAAAPDKVPQILFFAAIAGGASLLLYLASR